MQLICYACMSGCPDKLVCKTSELDASLAHYNVMSSRAAWASLGFLEILDRTCASSRNADFADLSVEHMLNLILRKNLYQVNFLWRYVGECRAGLGHTITPMYFLYKVSHCTQSHMQRLHNFL